MVLFPHANGYQIDDESFRRAWKSLVVRFSTSLPFDVLPRLSRRCGLDVMEDMELHLSLEYLCKLLVPGPYKGAAQATNDFLRLNAHIVIPTPKKVLNRASGRLVDGARILGRLPDITDVESAAIISSIDNDDENDVDATSRDEAVDTVEYAEVSSQRNLIETNEAYLSGDQDTKDFVVYLRGLLGNGPPFSHCYRHRQSDTEWQCLGLLDAAARYQFRIVAPFWAIAGAPPRSTLTANNRVLDKLRTDLLQARATNNETLAVDTAIGIQIWGGTNRGGYNERAIRVASGRPGGFLKYLELCEKSFGSGVSVDLSPFIGSGHGVRSNAGFTKIYSLAFDKFIIYDSRVAAALGLLVVRSLATSGKLNVLVPPSIAFLADNRGQPGARRDPNRNVFGISGFGLIGAGNHFDHLKWNIRANALLTEALKGSAFEKHVMAAPSSFPANPLRVLEAALFMIGYDLGGNWPHFN